MTENEPADDFQEDQTPWRPGDELSPENQTVSKETPSAQLGDQAPCADEQNDLLDSAAQTDESDSVTEPEITTEAVVEAVLFAADEPVTARKLAEIVATGGTSPIKEHIARLNQKYQQMNCSFRIEAIAGGFQVLTLEQFNPWLRKLIKVRSETKLSSAGLETLAIIAYKQPILRIDVEAIRGVAAGEMIRQLCEKGLVKIVGRAEELGRPLLYGTTKRFLEVFGLGSLKELPKAEELKPPA